MKYSDDKSSLVLCYSENQAGLNEEIFTGLRSEKCSFKERYA